VCVFINECDEWGAGKMCEDEGMLHVLLYSCKQ